MEYIDISFSKKQELFAELLYYLRSNSENQLKIAPPSMPRHFSPYERNQLQRAGISLAAAARHGDAPVEYIIGAVQFGTLRLSVSNAVLIPRVETEELVAHVLADLATLPASTEPFVLDVGTGSGAIGLSLVTDHPTVSVLASDVSLAALTVARQNAHQLLSTTQQTRWFSRQSYLLSALPSRPVPEIIVANLPYIPTKRLAELDSSVRDFEPQLALDGSDDGAHLIRQLLSQVHERYFLASTQPIVWLEIDHTHTTELLLKDVPGSWQVEILPDSFGRQRFAKLRLA